MFNNNITVKTFLASTIRDERRARRASQTALGTILGLTQPEVSFLENGKLPLALTAECAERVIASTIAQSRTKGGAHRVGRLR